MSWLILTILAVACRSGYSVVAKLMTNTMDIAPGTQNLLMTGSTLILTLICAPLLGGIQFQPVVAHLPQVIIMITTASFGGIAFFKGQKHLDASITQIAFSSILFWGLLFSIVFLGSTFNPVQLFGVLLLLSAILLVSAHTGKLKLDTNIVWIFVSAAFFAAFQVSSASLSKQLTTATYLLLSFGGPTIIVGVLYAGVIRSDLVNVMKQRGRAGGIIGMVTVLAFGYYIFSFKAYERAPDAGIVVILLTTQVVLSVILGILLLRERDHRYRKIIAGIVALVASGLIKAG